jgi:transposase
MEINYLCGIDVSKSSFSIAVKNGSFIIKDRLFEMNRSGFSKFEQLIRGFKPSIRIGMESTGIYHKNLSNFLKDSGYNTVEIDPYEM